MTVPRHDLRIAGVRTRADDLHDINVELKDVCRTMQARERYPVRPGAPIGAERWNAVRALIDEKIAQEVQQYSAGPPTFLVHSIGRPPTDQRGLDRWQYNARLIMRWRLDNAITGSEPVGLNDLGLPAGPPAALRLQLRVEPAARPIDPPDLAIGI